MRETDKEAARPDRGEAGGGGTSVVDELIRQLAEELAAARSGAVSGPAHDEAGAGDDSRVDQAALAAALEKYRPGEPAASARDGQAHRAPVSRDTQPRASGGREAGAEERATASVAKDATELLQIVRQALASGNIEVYLQPILGLPDRKVRYFEAFPRLIDPSGAPVAPADYAPLAREAGLLAHIDMAAFGRTLQILDRLAARGQPRDIFYKVSAEALADAGFIEGLGALVRQKGALAGHLVLEVGQSQLGAGSGKLRETLGELAALGLRFALTGVEDWAMDFEALGRQGFAFVKVRADRIPDTAGPMGAGDASAGLAGLRTRVEAGGLALIVEGIEDDRALARVLEQGPALGQGGLLSEPRPVRQDVLGDGRDSQGEKAA